MDKKRKVRIGTCLPGMVTAETIYNNYGAVIVWENTKLDDSAINRLKDFRIEDIFIFESSLPHNQEQPPEETTTARVEEAPFTEVYEKDTDAFKSVLYDLSTGKTVSLNKTIEIANSVYSRKNDNRDIINCVTQIRKVDEYTYYHSVNVSLLSMLIGKWLKLSSDDIYMLVQAGLMHDIGKSLIPSDLINKPGELTEEEFLKMKKHSEFGYYLVKNMKGVDSRVSEAVHYHHEREDGSGYPFGLRGDQISQFAKIVAVADTFDSMTANRAFKLKKSPFEVFEMMQNSCFGYLNTVIIDVFLANISHYYVGYKVKLSDKRIAEVVYINRQHYGKPVLKINDAFLDMSVVKNVAIEEVI
ncbi:MAG: HD-GYP domain-containing protein [Thermoclostridium sp.]|nr:HD-GYP domain-containing protein [Thermoclostridium sp.]